MASHWCFAVLVFSFLAARADAQIDSNAIVKLFCGPVSDGCNVVLRVPPGSTDTFNESMTINFDGSYRISEEDHSEPGTTFGILNPPFEIDSINKQIVNLQVYRATSGGNGENALLISFPPIPYLANNNHISIEGSYSCTYTFWSVYQYRFIQGKCQDSGSTIDSLSLEISPSPLAVYKPTSISQINFFVNGILESEFATSLIKRSFEIWNPMGQIVLRGEIGLSESSHEVSLPPGLYFAHLGDQVEKFIVPPR